MNYGILGIFIAKDIFHLLLQDSESHVSTLSLHKVMPLGRIPQWNLLLYQSFTNTDSLMTAGVPHRPRSERGGGSDGRVRVGPLPQHHREGRRR